MHHLFIYLLESLFFLFFPLFFFLFFQLGEVMEIQHGGVTCLCLSEPIGGAQRFPVLIQLPWFSSLRST